MKNMRSSDNDEIMNMKPNIILASFPRSGNTFLRNILHSVYGRYSWNNIQNYNKKAAKLLSLSNLEKKGELTDKKKKLLSELRIKFQYRIIKTHELPENILPFCDEKTHIIYLVRDGRDALVSMAHHRKDITEPGTKFLKNLEESMISKGGSYIGGWSRNVEEWLKVADVVIRFEDIINDPIRFTETFSSFLELPVPIKENIPTFKSQKEGNFLFGSKMNQAGEKESKAHSNKFFRKGKAGVWKKEMPSRLQKIFWKEHGHSMNQLAYFKDGAVSDFKLIIDPKKAEL